MKILFIIPSTGYYSSALSNPLGVLSIGTFLYKKGYKVKIYDRNVDKANLNKIMKEYNPDIVGISILSSRCLKDALKVSKTVKKYNKTLVWGGQIPTMNTELCFQCEYLDYIVMGEGEITFYELVQKIEKSVSPKNIDGIAYREKDRVVITKCREFADLKDFPIIDWTLADPAKYYQKYFHSDKMLYLYSSKGCPCNCAFCGNIEFHRCTYRKRPTDIVIKEIENLINDYQMDAVYFSDELWCAKKEDAYEFCRKVKEKNLAFVWGCDSRIGQYSREDLQMMYDANCRWILFGVESGSESMLKRINKGISIADVEENIRDCQEIGITTIATFIIGFPGETEEQLKETVDLAMGIQSKLIQVNHYFPTPGSELQKELVESGQYELPKTIKELGRVIAQDTLRQNFSKVSSRDLRVVRSFFHWTAFTGKDTINQDGAYAFAKQAILDLVNAITKKGLPFFFVGLFTAAKQFLYVFWHVVAYPGVRKKYGLHIKRKQ